MFLGPSATAIEMMGDKITAKNAVAAFDVPVVPGIARPGLTDDELIDGGRRGRLPGADQAVRRRRRQGHAPGHRAGQLADALASARREAASAFGDDTPVPRALRAATPPHRGADARRCARQRRPPRRARVQPAAPPPEGRRGGALAAARSGDPRPDRRRGVQHRAQRRLRRRRHGRVHRLRATRPTSSSSWR